MGKKVWGKKKSIVYIKAGSFFLVGFLLFFIAIFSIKEVNFLKKTYPITIKFEFVEGLRSSSPVRFCGVDVGEIKKVIVRNEGDRSLVYVTAKIHEKIKIPKNAHFFINSLSLFGEKYLEIGSSPSAGAYIEEGDIIEGISPVSLFDIFTAFAEMIEEAGKFIKDEKTKTSFESTMANIENLSLGLNELIKDIRDKNGTMGKFIYDDSLYRTTEEFIKDLKAHPWKLLYKPKKIKEKRK